ncbi:MAG TPA: hypothetical protein DCE42_13320, partial [Myxococcales bacterium]|nr:hypothetical protein [Myxococcales bacterium]
THGLDKSHSTQKETTFLDKKQEHKKTQRAFYCPRLIVKTRTNRTRWSTITPVLSEDKKST